MIKIHCDNIDIERSVVALGKFQGLHRGHMLLVDEIVNIARENALKSVVYTINFPNDNMILLDEERYEILEKKGVDYIVECEFTPEFANISAADFVNEVLVKKLKAHTVVVGEDFRFGRNREGNIDLLKEFGQELSFKVIAFKKLEIDKIVASTSYLRELLLVGGVSKMSLYMGRDYNISGKVIHGKELGRTIGFPTINLQYASRKLLPAAGVYETYVFIHKKKYKAITNIGNNPTVCTDSDIKIETHILDYEGDLYGKNMTIYFKRKIRGEIKFNNVAELKEQLKKDKLSVTHQ